MIYNTERSLVGINQQVLPKGKTYICMNPNPSYRFDFDNTKRKGNWVKCSKDYWVYLGPQELTQWSK